jgi:NADPH:quinone reductase
MSNTLATVALPAMMNVVLHGSGGPADCMKMGQAALPVPQPDEVLIKVAVTGVNRPDVAQRQGTYPPPPGASPYIGLEAAGTVIACGSAVTEWKVGDQVCALTNGGAYAEYVCAPEGQTLPIPKGLSLLQGAALPENYFTVYTNVIERGRLTKGETILIHGGSSGIGITAIQMAKAWGATVYCTVGSEDKREACLKLGADAAFNYRTQDYVEQVATLTNKRGVDLVLDMVAGTYTDRNLKCLAMDGRLVQIALLEGGKLNLDITPIMTKRLTFTGSTLRPRTSAQKAGIARALRRDIWPLIEKGQLQPVIFETFALSQVVQAHALMESSKHIGKIMLQVA